MKAAAMLAAAFGLGLLVAGCTSGPSATDTTGHRPSAAETAACAPIVKFKLPPGAGRPGSGVGVAIALPPPLVTDLIHSGDPKLVRDARTIMNSRSPGGVDPAFIGAQTECRKIGVT